MPKDESIDERICAKGEYGAIPEGFLYGTEYTNDEINLALEADNPWEVVPSRDTDGHGTFMAGVACGNRIEEKDFSGIASASMLCVVKCKEAKRSLKNYYRITTNEPVYAEQDIMAAVSYIRKKANELGRPFVLCLGMGTSMSGNSRGGFLGEYLEVVGDFRGSIVITGSGNEGNTGHHYRSSVLKSKEETTVELQVGTNDGFLIEIWSDAPQLFSLGLVSPSGEYSGKTDARIGQKRTVNFILDETTVDIEYKIVANVSGDECIQLRFRNPSQGIWKIRMFNESQGNALFDMWLPIRNFLPATTYFLEADPYITLCNPSNNVRLISNSYYDSYTRSISVDSGRGYTRNGATKPDFAVPGVNIYGPVIRRGNAYPATPEERMLSAQYELRSGSSCATAVTSGIAALLLEWGVVRGNDITMDTMTVQKYLIRGADSSGITEPNRYWGNGTINLYDVFERLRGN